MITATKRGEGDEERSELASELQSWLDLFAELAEAAEEAGFTSVVTITGYDPITGQSNMGYGYNGDTYAALGAAMTTVRMLEGE